MTPDFWQQRWQEKRIGFNQAEVNHLLIRYFDKLYPCVVNRLIWFGLLFKAMMWWE